MLQIFKKTFILHIACILHNAYYMLHIWNVQCTVYQACTLQYGQFTRQMFLKYRWMNKREQRYQMSWKLCDCVTPPPAHTQHTHISLAMIIYVTKPPQSQCSFFSNRASSSTHNTKLFNISMITSICNNDLCKCKQLGGTRDMLPWEILKIQCH
jgi:hypothetical protein